MPDFRASPWTYSKAGATVYNVPSTGRSRACHKELRTRWSIQNNTQSYPLTPSTHTEYTLYMQFCLRSYLKLRWRQARTLACTCNPSTQKAEGRRIPLTVGPAWSPWHWPGQLRLRSETLFQDKQTNKNLRQVDEPVNDWMGANRMMSWMMGVAFLKEEMGWNQWYPFNSHHTPWHDSALVALGYHRSTQGNSHNSHKLTAENTL